MERARVKESEERRGTLNRHFSTISGEAEAEAAAATAVVRTEIAR